MSMMKNAANVCLLADTCVEAYGGDGEVWHTGESLCEC